MAEENGAEILKVRDLEVKFFQEIGTVNAVNGVDLTIEEGRSIGVVGESGCGKTITSYAILSLIHSPGRITSGEILLTRTDGTVVDITQLDPDGEQMRKIRGRDISMIFQEPMTALSPVHTINNQISEAILIHQDKTREEARERVIELLRLVGISNPEQRAEEFAFQLSGGMRQRAMIAMALACNPRILIADEPTTALDVTIQAQVLKLIRQMQDEFNLSLMLITHDLGVVAHMVDYVYVMYLGKIVEAGPVESVFIEPQHPYTSDLLHSIPRVRGEKQGKIYSIQGSVPDTYVLPSGCAFHPRCKEIIGDVCKEGYPERVQVGEEHYVNCFKHTDRQESGENIAAARNA